MSDLSPGTGAPQGAPMDRYVVLEYLAEGGMGAIYIGKKLGAGGFEKEVVLKQLLPEFTRQPEFIDLFLREARLSATLDHANIIHTIDLVTAGDEYFIVMEYLPGADLRTLVKRVKRFRKRLSPAAALYVAREVLSALAYAHEKHGPDGKHLRLIHRDISPSNVLISKNGEVKLTDFGIAKASTHNSVFYRVKGKVGYMSPEQAKSEPLDHRSDLYSLAVCLYEMITGERLFVAAGLTTSADELYSQPVPMVSRTVEGVPTEFDKVMIKALSLNPAARYQTAGEFQEALLRVAHRHGLMMSAPELADELRRVCGNPAHWREDPTTAAVPVETGLMGSGGTELYDYADPEGTEQIDVSDVDMEGSQPDLIEVVGDSDDQVSSLIDMNSVIRRRQKTSVTHLTELQGIELTSMINLASVSNKSGGQPLVDLDDELGRGAAPARKGSPEIVEIASLAGRDEESTSGSTGAPAPVMVPRPRAADATESDYEDESAGRGVWVVLALILVIGLGIAAAIGFTGPTLVPDATGGGTTEVPATPAPTAEDSPGPAGDPP